MDSFEGAWLATAAAENVITLGCAAVAAAHFLDRHARLAPSGRRTAALALALTALGALAQGAASASWQADPVLIVAAGLPGCIGQALVALLVARERVR